MERSRRARLNDYGGGRRRPSVRSRGGFWGRSWTVEKKEIFVERNGQSTEKRREKYRLRHSSVHSSLRSSDRRAGATSDRTCTSLAPVARPTGSPRDTCRPKTTPRAPSASAKKTPRTRTMRLPRRGRADAEAPAGPADPVATPRTRLPGTRPRVTPAQEEANAPAAPAPSATLTEALDLLAPKSRSGWNHASGSVQGGWRRLAELGEFSPAQAVEILDRLTEDALKGWRTRARSCARSCRASARRRRRRRRPRRRASVRRPPAVRLRVRLLTRCSVCTRRASCSRISWTRRCTSTWLRCPSTPRSRRSTSWPARMSPASAT